MIPKLLVTSIFLFVITTGSMSRNIQPFETEKISSRDFHINYPQKSTQLKILSWNIFMLPYLSRFNATAERAVQIAEELRHSSYHILVFQEAFSNHGRKILSSKLKKEYPYQYGPANKCMIPFKTNSGLWILSKIPLTKLDEIKFNISEGFDGVAQKGAVLFSGTHNGSAFQIVATHLQADGKPGIRESQCNQINKQLLQKHHHENVPQIICGDFNIEMTDHEHYDLMLSTLEAQNGHINGDIQYTYDEINNSLVRNQGQKKKLIDYILVRNEYLIHKVERKVQTFYSKIGKKFSHLSDHYALEAEIHFNSAETAMVNNTN